MVITVFLPLFGLLVGVSVAWAARLQIRRGSRHWRDPYLPGMLLYELLVLIPLAMVLMIAHPAWASLYLLEESSALLEWLPWLAAAATLLLSVLGYTVAAHSYRMRHQSPPVLAFILLAAGLLLGVWLSFPRWLHLTDAGNFLVAPKLLEVKAGLLLVVSVPLTLGGWVFLLVFFLLEGRRISRATRRIAAPPLATAEGSPAGIYDSKTALREFLSPSELERLAGDALPPPSSPGEEKPKESV